MLFGSQMFSMQTTTRHRSASGRMRSSARSAFSWTTATSRQNSVGRPTWMVQEPMPSSAQISRQWRCIATIAGTASGTGQERSSSGPNGACASRKRTPAASIIFRQRTTSAAEAIMSRNSEGFRLMPSAPASANWRRTDSWMRRSQAFIGQR